MSSDPVWPEYDERTQAMVDAMVEAEERALAARKADLEDCDCKEGMFPTAGRPASRRSFLAATAAMAGGTTLGLAAGDFDKQVVGKRAIERIPGTGHEFEYQFQRFS